MTKTLEKRLGDEQLEPVSMQDARRRRQLSQVWSAAAAAETRSLPQLLRLLFDT